jgi:hypothetical protein
MPLQVIADDGPQPPETHLPTVNSWRARTHLGRRPRWGLDEALQSVSGWYVTRLAGEEMGDVTRREAEAFAIGAPMARVR